MTNQRRLLSIREARRATTAWRRFDVPIDVPELTHHDCGQPMTITPGSRPDPLRDANPDATMDARNLFYCRHCGDGRPHRQDPDCGCGYCYDAND
jgi:hypothetical protein